jgi:hypothetical protein
MSEDEKHLTRLNELIREILMEILRVAAPIPEDKAPIQVIASNIFLVATQVQIAISQQLLELIARTLQHHGLKPITLGTKGHFTFDIGPQGDKKNGKMDAIL